MANSENEIERLKQYLINEHTFEKGVRELEQNNDPEMVVDIVIRMLEEIND